MDNRYCYNLVAEEWRRRGMPLKSPATDSDLSRVFAELGVPLSADVRDLYTTVGGFQDYEWDGFWSFWSLDRLREESKGKQKPFVMFADWLIWSHAYCLHYENPEVSSVYITYDGRSLEPDPIASCVAEFLEKLLCNPDEVDAFDLDNLSHRTVS